MATQYATLDDGSRIKIDVQSKTWAYVSQNENIKSPEQAVNTSVILELRGNKEDLDAPSNCILVKLQYLNNPSYR